MSLTSHDSNYEFYTIGQKSAVWNNLDHTLNIVNLLLLKDVLSIKIYFNYFLFLELWAEKILYLYMMFLEQTKLLRSLDFLLSNFTCFL